MTTTTTQTGLVSDMVQVVVELHLFIILSLLAKVPHPVYVPLGHLVDLHQLPKKDLLPLHMK